MSNYHSTSWAEKLKPFRAGERTQGMLSTIDVDPCGPNNTHLEGTDARLNCRLHGGLLDTHLTCIKQVVF